MIRIFLSAFFLLAVSLPLSAQVEGGFDAFWEDFPELGEDFYLDGEELGDHPGRHYRPLDTREVQLYLFPEFQGISRVTFFKVGRLRFEGKVRGLIYLTLEENEFMRDCRAKLALFDEENENFKEIIFARRKEAGPSLRVTFGSLNPDFTLSRLFYTYHRDMQGQWKLHSMSKARLEIPEIRRIPPDRTFGAFKVSGFQYYENALEEGVAALLYHYGRFVDTIDWYSPERIGTGLAYIKVTGCGKPWTSDTAGCGLADGYWFHNSRRKVPFQDFLRGYDPYFSSPQVQGGKIWYYEIYRSEEGHGGSKVWFGWYRVATAERMRVYLGEFDFGTDYRYVLEPASFSGNRISLNAFGKQWVLDQSLRILERPAR